MTASPRRRVLLALGPSSGGIGRHVRSLADSLPERGWDTVVAGPRELSASWTDGLGERFVPLGIPGDWRTGRSAASGLGVLLDRYGPGVVHAHGLRAGLTSAAVARRHHVPSVVTVHNVVSPETAGRAWRLARAAEPILGRLASVPIGASPEITARLGARARTVYVAAPRLESHLDREAVRTELGLTSGDVLVVCVARLHRQKRLDVLVEAARQLGVTVLIAGAGPRRGELEALITATRAPVRLLGRRADVADLYAAADVAVLTSAWEAVPLALREAAQFGLPLVGTDSGGTPLVVRDGRTGILVPPGDVAATRAALERLAGDARLRHRLGECARRLEASVFGEDAMLDAITAAYEEALR